MVKGVTRPADERMSTQAKVVFGIVITLSIAILVIAYFGNKTSSDAKAALNRQDCRALFTAPITDANQQNVAADNEVRKGQVLAQYYGATGNDEAFNDAVELGFTGLQHQYEAEFIGHWYNQEYQTLIRAQEHDRERFAELCNQGPRDAPPIPPYKAPPR